MAETFEYPREAIDDFTIDTIRDAAEISRLAAEVERLQGLVATGDRLRAEDAMDTLKAQARVAELEARLAAARVAVGMVYAPARGPGTIAYDRWLEARRTVGLEG